MQHFIQYILGSHLIYNVKYSSIKIKTLFYFLINLKSVQKIATILIVKLIRIEIQPCVTR